MRKDFMEWFLALLRRDMEEFPLDQQKKYTLFEILKRKRKG